MKKIISTMLVFVVSLSLAGMAIAASPRPPATICFDTSESTSKFSLLIKPMGTIKMSGGPERVYSIQGLYYDDTNGAATVVGSGYMDGSVFHFSLNGTYTWQGTAGFFQMDAYWDVHTKTGPMYSVWNNTTHYEWSLERVPCTDH